MGLPIEIIGRNLKFFRSSLIAISILCVFLGVNSDVWAHSFDVKMLSAWNLQMCENEPLALKMATKSFILK